MSEYQTVEQARAEVMAAANDGTKCPCCGQNVKVYERAITGGMARALVAIYKATPQAGPQSAPGGLRGGGGHDWVHVPTLLRRNGIGEKHVAMMRYWGLVVQKPGERDDGSKATGWWMITALGVQFVQGLVKLPQKVRVFNTQFLGVVAGSINVGIADVAGKTFNYRELMGSPTGGL